MSKSSSMSSNKMSTKSSRMKRRFTQTSCLVLLAFGASGSVVAESNGRSNGQSDGQSNDLRYTMTVIRDAAQGANVVKGDYEKAVARITGRRVALNPFAGFTNLCVAYAKIGKIDEADDACDTALAIVRDPNWEHRSGVMTGYGERTRRKYLALALSNRGVLHAIRGDESAAEQSFDEAIKLDQRNTAPRVNLARLEAGIPASV